MSKPTLPGALRPIATLPGHTDRAWHLSWSPSRPLLASCSSDREVRLHSFTPALVDGAPVYSFQHQSTIPTSHSRTVRSLAFNPTGTTLATASFDSTVGIWQQVAEAGIDDGAAPAGEGEWEALDPLEGHESECKSVEWSFDGRLLASCSRDKSVWIWEAIGPAEFECLAVLMEHSQDVKAVTWHPCEELLASASYDETIKLFAADPYDDEWTCTHTLTSHTATVWTVSFSPCGNYLASAGDDLVIKIWGRDSQVPEGGPAEAQREEGGRMGPWSGGGVRIGHSERWKWTLKTEIAGAHERTIYSVDWGKGGAVGGLGRLVTGGGDGVINVYQMLPPNDAGGALSFELIDTVESAHGVSDVNHVAWCKLSPLQAARTLRNLEGGEEPEMGDGETETEDPRWQHCADLFASAGDDGVIRVWQV